MALASSSYKWQSIHFMGYAISARNSDIGHRPIRNMLLWIIENSDDERYTPQILEEIRLFLKSLRQKKGESQVNVEAPELMPSAAAFVPVGED